MSSIMSTFSTKQRFNNGYHLYGMKKLIETFPLEIMTLPASKTAIQKC